MTILTTTGRREAPADPTTPARRGSALPRLLSAPADGSLDAHLDHWGPPRHPADLVVETERAGLRGRGGAAFPTAVKLAAVRREAATGRRRGVVVANGSEGEPASAKDRVLLARNPHLVVDGMVAAARAVGADRAILCIKQTQTDMVGALADVVAERPPDGVAIELAPVPPRYLAGEESALVNFLTSGRALPTLSPPRPAQRGVDRRPTLVDNVETLANLALIARFGARWVSGVGTPEDPGALLVTVSGAVERPGVVEVAFGTPLTDVLARAAAAPAAGVLVGGYFGTWLSPGQAARARLSRASLASLGAGLGCGAVVVMPRGVCPLAEVARVTHWLAGQSAGQCGPCANGLPAIARALDRLVGGPDATWAGGEAVRLAGLVTGRGACKLPDGAAQFVASALSVFADHVAAHERAGPCPPGTGVLTTPAREALR